MVELGSNKLSRIGMSVFKASYFSDTRKAYFNYLNKLWLKYDYQDFLLFYESNNGDFIMSL